MEPKYGHELTDQAVEHRSSLRQEHTDFINFLIAVKGAVGRTELGVENMVDMVYLLKEVSKFADDMKKEAGKMTELLQKVCCYLWSQDPEAQKRIVGHVAAGTPKPSMVANLPDRKSPEYKQLAAWVGMTPAQVDADVVRIHWPHFQERISQLAAAGDPLPPGITGDMTRPSYVLVAMLLKKGVHID